MSDDDYDGKPYVVYEANCKLCGGIYYTDDYLIDFEDGRCVECKDMGRHKKIQ